MSTASTPLKALGQPTFQPGYGPEWGSGGVYGLKYHKGILYFTLAFEAHAYFIHTQSRTPILPNAYPEGDSRREGEKYRIDMEEGLVVIYKYGQVGESPGARSGGDTYNASTAVDDTIFFGGWVHAPPSIRETRRGRELDFTSKYSHIHAYDTRDQRVRLLWSETIGHPRLWAGEVSELVYDPLRDSLYAARGDGHDRLGIYEVDMKGRARRVSPNPVLKGTVHLDHACFTLHGPGEWKPFTGYTCVELGSGKTLTTTVEPGKAPSPDGAGVLLPRAGSAVSAYTRLYALVRGGVFMGDPLSGDELVFYRILDFYPSHYGPLRVNAITPLGAPVGVWNNMSHTTLVGTEEVSGSLQAESRRILGPSLLLSLDGPTPRIVASLGVRATSIESLGDSILVGYSTWPNLERYDSTRLDAGTRGLAELSMSILASSQPPSLALRPPPSAAWNGRTFGGIPLAGYRRPRVLFRSREGIRVRVYTYNIGDPPGGAEVDTYTLGPGRVELDLSGHGWGIVSFRVLEGRVEWMAFTLA